jgi:hypothetical protein
MTQDDSVDIYMHHQRGTVWGWRGNTYIVHVHVFCLFSYNNAEWYLREYKRTPMVHLYIIVQLETYMYLNFTFWTIYNHLYFSKVKDKYAKIKRIGLQEALWGVFL